MKKLFLILFINFYSFSSFCMLQVDQALIQKLDNVIAECAECENIYQQQQEIANLTIQLDSTLSGVENWLKTQSAEKLKNQEILSWFKDIQNITNDFRANLARKPVIDQLLNSLPDLLYKIDPLLPPGIKFDDNDFLENLKKIAEVDNLLRNLSQPSNYANWLSRRQNLK
jgi:hypothetical protein